ncbi:MAG: family 43 glycosylhydrolase [Erysipelotrichaceae bacterium]|nr:family 43 glycosylhydrolase [Erysipelotrichaceae bacterium]
MILNNDTKLNDLLKIDAAKNLLNQMMPSLLKMAEGNPQALSLSLNQLIQYTKVPQGDLILKKTEEAFAQLMARGKIISPEEEKHIKQFAAIWEEEMKKETKEETHRQDAAYPGQVWLDTKGERIQAHGGAMYYEDGTYYWYGENKEYTDGANGIWTWGLKVYASKDLYNWKDLGYLLKPEISDPDSSLFPTKRTDRPHIVKCEKTGKYVLWYKLSGPEACFGVYQADSLLGKYTMVENMYRPAGYKIGDFDLIVDEKTKNAYIYFDGNHASTVCMKLTEDYLHAESVVKESYAGLKPPFTREAQSLFELNGVKYMLTSSMSGYVPNQSDAAVADHWEDEFVSVGDPHENDETHASFNSQISKIFRIAGTNRYVAMADRWLSEYHVDARIADLFVRAIGSVYDPEHYQATEEEKREMYAANKLETANTRVADYVWLPVIVTAPSAKYPKGRVIIRWCDSWKTDEEALWKE